MTLLYAYATVTRGRSCWLIEIPHCPFCSRSHVHGGGSFSDDPRKYLSTRVPHCADHARDAMYWLTADPSLQGQAVPADWEASVQ